MSEAGLTFPAPPASDNLQLENHLIDQISQEIIVARFVAESVGRGRAHAEAEEAASAIIELKDQEISRLQDKLQYYETVNHEMSQRNLIGKPFRIKISNLCLHLHPLSLFHARKCPSIFTWTWMQYLID